MKFKKDDGSSFLNVVIVWAMFAIAIIITIYIYVMSLTSALKTQLEGDMEIANLSAATIDISNYTETGKFTITDTKKAYDDFIYTFKTNMSLQEDEDRNILKPATQSYFDGIVSSISVVDFYVYNVDGSEITLSSYNVITKSIQTSTYYGGAVNTPDGAIVDSPTIYSKIEVNTTLPGGIMQTITRENTVAVVIK